jgi:hypothetical protein
MRKKVTVKKYRVPRSLRKMFPKVEYAVDAHAPVYVTVGDKDCKDARKLNPSECALARATKRELHADGVIIGMSTSYIIKGKQAVRYDTPQSVAREIVSFDRHGDFATGDYHLTPKAPSIQFGAERNRPSDSGGKNKNARRKVHMSARVRMLPKGR